MTEQKVCSQSLIRAIHHVALLCADKAASIAFYEALAFRVRETYVRPERKDEIVYMQNNDILLELFAAAGHPARPSEPEAYGLRHLAFAVNSVATVYDELSKAGYQPEAIRHDTYTGELMFFVKDPDGLPIEIHE